MADNFLEKRQEALRSGKTVIRRVNPSIDELLGRAGGREIDIYEWAGECHDASAASPALSEAAAADVVKAAQLEAMLRSARKLGIGFSAEFAEGAPAQIRLSLDGDRPQDPPADLLLLGQFLLALRLKAESLHLTVSSAHFSRTSLAVEVRR